jgi:hypothetical protein
MRLTERNSTRYNGRWLMLIFVMLLVPLGLAAQKAEKQNIDALYGLYYGDWDNPGSDLAIVISSNGLPIPPKANDPDAPTKPGFYIGQIDFEFESSEFSLHGFTFRTKKVNGTFFSFAGRFGREQDAEVGEVPYLEGELKEVRNDHVVRHKKVHFAHAVIL